MHTTGHSSRISIAVAVLATTFAGCATRGPTLEPPVVELAGVEIEAMSFSAQSFRLHFDVSNPNAIPLPVRELRYSVMLERRQFASGASGRRFTIPANGDTSFDMSVELDLLGSAASLAPLLTAGASRPLEYALYGSFEIALPFAKPLNFSRQGTILVR